MFFRTLAALAAGLALLTAAPAQAQPYPNKPVRIIVPYTPGGGIDVLARLLAQKLSEMWGQPVVVDNRPGGGGTLGAGVAAKSAPDGYTFVIASNTLALSASAQPKPSYDVMKDFAPAILATRAPFVLGVNPKAGAKNVRELLAVAKARTGGLNFASSGAGTTSHLAIEMMKNRTGMPALHVPYKGSNPALTDLIDGRVDALFATAAAIMPHTADGKLLAMAVTGKQRSPSAPGVPTMIEAGVPGFDVTVWFGLLAPAGTPRAIVEKFHTDSVKVLNMPDVVEKLKAQGQDIAPLGPDEFSAFLRDEISGWADVVRQANLKFE